MILFLAECPQQVQMFWVADCHSRVQDQGAHVVFVDHSFHPRDPGHVDLNQNNRLSRPRINRNTERRQKPTMGSTKTASPRLNTALARCGTPWIVWLMALVTCKAKNKNKV